MDSRKPFDVIAFYDYNSSEQGAPQGVLSLKKGQRLTVFDDSREHWWHATNANGEKGFIPSNCVDRIEPASEEWFFRDISREEAETILKAENKKGCFLVRNSKSKSGMYTLSMADPNVKIFHYRIEQDEQRKYYVSSRHRFETFSQLVKYHQHNGGGLVARLRRPPQHMRPKKPPTRDKWEIDPADLTLGHELRSGEFDRVVQGMYKGNISVVIKMMKEGTMDEADFIEEAKVIKNLQHANLVKLYGVVTVQRPIYIVTELLSKGCLLNYLRKHRELRDRPDILVGMATQVAAAMKFLEQHQFIHRDLAARNCHIGDNNQVKIADFSMTRYVLDDEYTECESMVFPIKWAAPEVISYAKYSSKSDVWSFGVLMWELFTGGLTPYPTFSDAQVVDEVLRGYHLERPGSCSPEVYELMRETWKAAPEDRPNFDYLHRCLTKNAQK